MHLCLLWSKKCAADESDILGICSFNFHVLLDLVLVQNNALHHVLRLLVIMRKQLSMLNPKLLIHLLSALRPADS